MTDAAYSLQTDDPPAELEPVHDDLGDPFANVPEEWRALCGIALSHFRITDLPALFQPFVGPAMMALAARLATDPAGSRIGAVEIIGEAISCLHITPGELGVWDRATLLGALDRAAP